jgi:hypothetical protein
MNLRVNLRAAREALRAVLVASCGCCDKERDAEGAGWPCSPCLASLFLRLGVPVERVPAAVAVVSEVRDADASPEALAARKSALRTLIGKDHEPAETDADRIDLASLPTPSGRAN